MKFNLLILEKSKLETFFDEEGESHVDELMFNVFDIVECIQQEVWLIVTSEPANTFGKKALCDRRPFEVRMSMKISFYNLNSALCRCHSTQSQNSLKDLRQSDGSSQWIFPSMQYGQQAMRKSYRLVQARDSLL